MKMIYLTNRFNNYSNEYIIHVIHWGLKKNPFSCLWQVDFSFEQVAFIGTCSVGKGVGKLSAFEALKKRIRVTEHELHVLVPSASLNLRFFIALYVSG